VLHYLLLGYISVKTEGTIVCAINLLTIPFGIVHDKLYVELAWLNRVCELHIYLNYHYQDLKIHCTILRVVRVLI